MGIVNLNEKPKIDLSNSTAVFRRRVELQREKQQIKDREKAINADIASLDEHVIKHLTESGIDSIKIDGTTLYTRNEIRASTINKNYEGACKALREAGMDELIDERFNANSLSAAVRTMIDEGQEIPASFEGVIKVSENVVVGLRSS